MFNQIISDLPAVVRSDDQKSALRSRRKEKKCECCRNKVIYGNNKWCGACAFYIKTLKLQRNYYKRKSDNLNIKVYGNKSGAERIR
jgi:hypothetical protein